MANHSLTANFRSFFGRLNPSASFEYVASSEYTTIKGLIENRKGPAVVLAPTCFLQGSYRQQTATYSIDDVDIVALCQLWQPGSPGSGRTYCRNEIFDIIAAPLRADRRYASKLRFGPTSMCIKVDLGIKIEILPVVFKADNDDPQKEPFRLYRPETRNWEDGYARYHQQWLTWKNRQDKTAGNFIPAIKVFKHIRTRFNLDVVSFHIECLLFTLADGLFPGSPADYLLALFEHIAATPANDWYAGICRTPCGDRDIFTGSEWPAEKWTQFHEVIKVAARTARLAKTSPTQSGAIEAWQIILGAEYFPGKRFMRRILSIDGGGIRGTMPASFLATIEDSLGEPVTDYFDLIVGTSTGEIIALCLGAGLSAKQLLSFYETDGPQIFAGNQLIRWLRQLGIGKYDPAPLQRALEDVLGQRKLGESKKRLVIPSFNLDTGEVHIWKTSHHPRLECDHKSTMVEVAMATASAPTYFPTYRSVAGMPLIDGGMWANNPIAVAVVEAIGVLNWPRETLRVLSLGCGITPLDVRLGRFRSLGIGYWALKIVDVFMTAQATSALGMAQHLVPDRNDVVRICPTVSKSFGLDTVRELQSLKGMGATEARKALPTLRPLFFEAKAPDDFKPYHT